MGECKDLATLVSAAENELRRRGAVVTSRGGGEERGRGGDGETADGDGQALNGAYKANGKHEVPPIEDANPRSCSSSSQGEDRGQTIEETGRDGGVRPDAAGVKKPRQRKAWAPNGDDHWVYSLVKLDGLTQWEAADRARINQSTVSRLIERYERWKAHADPRDEGELDPAEKRRVQRWLTYERSERLLGKTLRLAGKMEECWEDVKTVKSYSSDAYAPSQDRTERQITDRTGMAARFLRLAHKITMELHKLSELEPPPSPEPLTPEQERQEEENAAIVRADFAQRRAGDKASTEAFAESRFEQFRREGQAVVDKACADAAAAREELEAAKRELAELREAARSTAGDRGGGGQETPRQAEGGASSTGDALAGAAPAARRADCAATPKLHKTHNCIISEPSVSTDKTRGSEAKRGRQKTPGDGPIDGIAPDEVHAGPDQRPRVVDGGMPLSAVPLWRPGQAWPG